jgi:hypothetical protein
MVTGGAATSLVIVVAAARGPGIARALALYDPQAGR